MEDGPNISNAKPEQNSSESEKSPPNNPQESSERTSATVYSLQSYRDQREGSFQPEPNSAPSNHDDDLSVGAIRVPRVAHHPPPWRPIVLSSALIIGGAWWMWRIQNTAPQDSASHTTKIQQSQDLEYTLLEDSQLGEHSEVLVLYAGDFEASIDGRPLGRWQDKLRIALPPGSYQLSLKPLSPLVNNPPPHRSIDPPPPTPKAAQSVIHKHFIVRGTEGLTLDFNNQNN